MPGDLPKPTALKILNGSAQHDPGRINRDEPAVEALPDVPAAPASLPVRARQQWVSLATEAVRLRVLSTSDLAMLEAVCFAHADFMTARRTKDWRRSADAWRRYVTGLREFGLSPSSRTKLHAIPAVKSDPTADLLTPRRRA